MVERMADIKQMPVWIQIAAWMVPTFITVLGAVVVLYGNLRQMESELQHLRTLAREEAIEHSRQLKEHGGQAAHGTVREDLATHDAQIAALQLRLKTVENHAERGERWTEDDEKQANMFLYQQFNEFIRDLTRLDKIVETMNTDMRNLRNRIRVLEHAP